MKLKNLFRKPETKASRAAPLLTRLGPAHGARFTPREYGQLAREGFMNNIVAYRAVSLVSRNAAAVPWAVFKNGRRLADHPLLTLLHRPNPCQGGAEFFAAAYGFYLLAGNSYIECVGPDAGLPRELWALRPDRMRVVAGPKGVPEAYRYEAGGGAVDYPLDPFNGRGRVLHVKTFHPLDDWYGLSPLEAAAFSVDQHNDAAKWNASLLQSGARPSGALVYAPSHPDAPDTLSEAQRNALKEELDAYFSGPANAGRPMVLEGGLDWRGMSLSPKDMDWLAGKDVSAREIALAFHVPPQLIGVEGSMTFANMEQARLALYDDAVIPLLDHFKDALNNWLPARFGENLTIGYDLDGVEALSPRREKLWARASAADFLSEEEKRVLVGLEKRA
jgi:HK97 family phage portal protein